MSKSNTPQTRSQSKPKPTPQTISMDTFQIAINEIKNDLLSSFTMQIDKLTSSFATLSSQIKSFECRLDDLFREQRCQRQEIDDLKASIEMISSEQPTKIFDEVENRLRRRHNVILRGLPEMSSGTVQERKEHDTVTLQNIFAYLGNDCIDITDNRRIGRPKSNGHRILKCTLHTEEQKWNLLRTAKTLRQSSQFKDVFISLDLTPLQQQEQKKLWTELKQRRAEGEDVVIRSGCVRPRNETQNF